MQAHTDPVPAPPWAREIQFRLIAAFVVVALLAAAFASAAIVTQLSTIERAASWEAERLAKTIAYGGTGQAFDHPEQLQHYVEQLRRTHQHDLVFVNSAKVDLADADPGDIGTVYIEDHGNEVGRTLHDGRPRTFVERSERHPQGIKEMVIAVRADKDNPASKIVGAAIVEYTQVYDTLLAAESNNLALFVLAALGCVLVSAIFGLGLARQLGRRLGTLEAGVSAVAAGDYDTSLPVRGLDELDRVSAGFNTMTQALKRKRDKLLDYGRTLEDKVAQRVAALRDSEARYQSLFELSPDGLLLHTAGRVVLVNTRCVELLGATAAEQLIGAPILDLFHPDHREGALLNWLGVDAAIGRRSEARLLQRDGSAIDAEVTASAIIYQGQPAVQMVVRDIAERKQAEARLTYLAQYDTLTCLPNRHLFRDRLAQAMVRADRDQQLMALLFVDLDRFKQINDSLGHAIGDAVLQAVAQRLRESLREVDTIARLGGDEFTIILERLAEPAHAAQVAEKIKVALAEPLRLDGREFNVSASIGIALHRCGDNDPDHLLQAADIAMYRAKDVGRNACVLFAPDMAAQVNERVTLEGALRNALERGEFELHYQPKLDLDSGRVVGVEALLRWHSQELGPVSPAKFIPVAEEMGLIVPIGDWVLRTACTQGRAWLQQGLAPLTMAVNLSPRQLRDPKLIDKIGSVLSESGFPAERLELELTEGLIMDNVAGNRDTLAAIRSLGVSLSIDDFGTGYSSLAYLAQLPVQTLKIDRAFIAALDDGPHAVALVTAIMTLAHSLKLSVVAEGVETAAQQDLLAQLQCDQLQGYFFSRPVPADALAAFVQRNSKLGQ
ncbi:MAG: putative bifunctional diguanylate cyclase/phosphodiesterase [Leptothrix sp. (in: b-proteobacteria)]